MKEKVLFISLLALFWGGSFSQIHAEEAPAASKYDFVEYDVEAGKEKIISFNEDLYEQMSDHLEISPPKKQSYVLQRREK
ncbi:hypothetical protein JZO66_14410 [Enterococcus sp. DIV0242_7C1]|uniref:Uncharacterized protein n=1 Tax=Candidatus Enterococcus dunnyi TaxID=1834192 RepID=A0AAQ3W4C8_9ENTE|nr:hypothetical protein [Enterococcus sp. DIV0242_7C1]MBO0471748.1 hypothetical protein [Enterococcus sp. DIV0242_7C1]